MNTRAIMVTGFAVVLFSSCAQNEKKLTRRVEELLSVVEDSSICQEERDIALQSLVAHGDRSCTERLCKLLPESKYPFCMSLLDAISHLPVRSAVPSLDAYKRKLWTNGGPPDKLNTALGDAIERCKQSE